MSSQQPRPWLDFIHTQLRCKWNKDAPYSAPTSTKRLLATMIRSAANVNYTLNGGDQLLERPVMPIPPWPKSQSALRVYQTLERLLERLDLRMDDYAQQMMLSRAPDGDLAALWSVLRSEADLETAVLLYVAEPLAALLKAINQGPPSVGLCRQQRCDYLPYDEASRSGVAYTDLAIRSRPLGVVTGNNDGDKDRISFPLELKDGRRLTPEMMRQLDTLGRSNNPSDGRLGGSTTVFGVRSLLKNRRNLQYFETIEKDAPYFVLDDKKEISTEVANTIGLVLEGAAYAWVFGTKDAAVCQGEHWLQTRNAFWGNAPAVWLSPLDGAAESAGKTSSQPAQTVEDQVWRAFESLNMSMGDDVEYSQGPRSIFGLIASHAYQAMTDSESTRLQGWPAPLQPANPTPARLRRDTVRRHIPTQDEAPGSPAPRTCAAPTSATAPAPPDSPPSSPLPCVGPARSLLPRKAKAGVLGAALE